MADQFNALAGSTNQFNALPFSPIANNVDRSIELLKFLNNKFPGVDTLVNHSKNNVRLGKTLDRGNGRISSISSMTVGLTDENGQNLRTFLVPTIFDGRALSPEEAKIKAEQAIRNGVQFPSVEGDNPQALDELSRLISDNLANASGLNNSLGRQ